MHTKVSLIHAYNVDLIYAYRKLILYMHSKVEIIKLVICSEVGKVGSCVQVDKVDHKCVVYSRELRSEVSLLNMIILSQANVTEIDLEIRSAYDPNETEW